MFKAFWKLSFLRKLLITFVVMAYLFSSIFFTTLFFKEKSLRMQLKNRVVELVTQQQISDENNDALKTTGETFIKTMFRYSNKTFPQAQKDTLQLVTGDAKKDYLASLGVDGETDTKPVDFDYNSDVMINTSSYSRIDVNSAMVTIEFTHSIIINKQATSAKYIAEVYLVNENGFWKVNKYHLEQTM